MVPEVHLSDPAVLGDPIAAYGAARERSPVVRLVAPGIPPIWGVTRHAEARAMLTDPRIELTSDTYLMRPTGIPERYARYLRTMQEMDGPEHTRQRRLVAPAFTARRAADFRPHIERVATGLLDALPDDPVDLLPHFARPLPVDVIAAVVGIPGADRSRWRSYGADMASGDGKAFAAAIPSIMDDAVAAVARRRAEPGDDLLSDLIRQADGGDRLSDDEIVTLVWHLVLAGQVPANLIAAAIPVLSAHPEQAAKLRADPSLLSGAVEELIRWCGPQFLSLPRYPRVDVEIGGVRIGAGEPVAAIIAAANRDPRVFAEPESFDVTRADTARHIGFAHGPHFCLGAALARVQTEIALSLLLRRFPDLTVGDAARVPDPTTWRLVSLPVQMSR